MECHYHPERESTDVCAICGKPICKECGLEIAGKIYCKDCLQKIIGLESQNEPEKVSAQDPIVAEPAATEEPVAPKEPIAEAIYATQEEEIYASPEPQESKKVADDSPYNIRDNMEYSGGLESSYLHEDETPAQEVAPAEDIYQEAPAANDNDYIYPDHSYEPQPTSARADLEDKYEKYLDDLYFDENDVSLVEQLAKDEEQYGSLTRKERPPKKPAEDQKIAKRDKPETPEEMEARIRAEILEEQGIKPKKGKSKENIHKLNYQEEKEPMGALDILLTIVLILVILVVIYYLLYLFILNSSYPTFMDAVYGLTNPQNVINNLLSHG